MYYVNLFNSYVRNKLYQVDKIPKLAQQKKTVGEQCAFQAHRNLMKSISLIASDPKQEKFIDDNIIRQTMSDTVMDILALMEACKRLEKQTFLSR